MKATTKILMLLVLIGLTTTGIAAPSKTFTRDVAVNTFQKLTAVGNMEIIFVDNNENKIRLEGSKQAIATVVMEQNDQELSVTRNENGDNDEIVTIYVPVSEMNTLIIGGDASVKCETTLHANVLSLLHKGTGSVQLKSDADVIQTMTTKSGRIAVEGAYTSTVSRMDASNHLIVAYSK